MENENRFKHAADVTRAIMEKRKEENSPEIEEWTETVLTALERLTPKEPLHKYKSDFWTRVWCGECPNCNNTVQNTHTTEHGSICRICGQQLDWS